MLPSGGLMMVVLPLRMWSPLNSRPSSSSRAHMVGRVAPRMHHPQGYG